MVAYAGSKASQCEFVTQCLNLAAWDGMPYYEPFLGSGSMMYRIQNKASYAGSDKEPLMICLLQSVQRGDLQLQLGHLSQDKWRHLRNLYMNGKHCVDIETASAYAIYSYNGFPFVSYQYIDRAGRNHVEGRVKSYMEKLHASSVFRTADFTCKDYVDTSFHGNTLIYCDPPYENTFGYPCCPDFDSAAFWKWARDRVLDGHMVFISEGSRANVPFDFISIKKWRKGSRIEMLFTHKSLIMRVICAMRTDLPADADRLSKIFTPLYSTPRAPDADVETLPRVLLKRRTDRATDYIRKKSALPNTVIQLDCGSTLTSYMQRLSITLPNGVEIRL